MARPRSRLTSAKLLKPFSSSRRRTCKRKENVAFRAHRREPFFQNLLLRKADHARFILAVLERELGNFTRNNRTSLGRRLTYVSTLSHADGSCQTRLARKFQFAAG